MAYGKELSSEEVAHYAKIITAIAETIIMLQSLDDLFEQVEASLFELKF